MTPNLMDTTAGNLADAGLPVLTVTALGRAGSRAVVVGTGTHLPGSALPGIPAVAATVTAVRDALTERCGMDGRHVVSVADPESPTQFLDAVNQAAAQAEDVLLLYYIGHGLVRLDGEFFLATAATTDREVMLPVEALPFAAVRGVLSASRARHVVVVLDCCFSGRASGVIGTAVADAFELANVHGSYLLSATSATGQALAPEGERYTAFSGALLEFLRDGDPTAPRGLTLDDAYRYLDRLLPSRGAPAPQRRLSGDAGRLVVAVNPRAPAVTRPRPDHPERIEPAPSAPRPCPYPGLDAFTADDTEYF
jgi:Caspase domain